MSPESRGIARSTGRSASALPFSVRRIVCDWVFDTAASSATELEPGESLAPKLPSREGLVKPRGRPFPRDPAHSLPGGTMPRADLRRRVPRSSGAGFQSSSLALTSTYTPMQPAGHGDAASAVSGTYTSFVRAFAATECEFRAVATFWIHRLVSASTTPSTGPPGLFRAAR